MHVNKKEPDHVGSGQVKGGPHTLVGSSLGVYSGPLPAELFLDMAPVLVGPGRGRGRDPAAALRPGPVEEKLANIAEPAPGDLELAVIYSRVHVKVRAGGSPQPFSLSMVPPPLGGHPQLFCHESNWQFKALCNFFNSVPTTAFVAKFNWFASWPPHTIPRFTAWVKRNPAP